MKPRHWILVILAALALALSACGPNTGAPGIGTNSAPPATIGVHPPPCGALETSVTVMYPTGTMAGCINASLANIAARFPVANTTGGCPNGSIPVAYTANNEQVIRCIGNDLFTGMTAPGAPLPQAPTGGPSAPQPTAGLAPTAAAQLDGCGNPPDFSGYVGKPYDLIAKLDSQEAKVPQGSTNFTVNAERGCLLYWTGAYTGGHLPTGFTPLFVDGQTGVYMVSKGTIATVNFVGAYMELAKFNPSAEVKQDAGDNPDGCMPAQKVADILSANNSTDPEAIFRLLDAATNVEEAPYLSARYRPTPDGPHTYNVKNTMAVFWVQSGQISGPTIELASSQGKSVYLSTEDGQVNLLHAHAGVRLCESLNPQQMLTYWPGYTGR